MCSCDGGRVCRPLIICDNGVPRVTTDHINKLKAGEWGFSDFLKRGERHSVERLANYVGLSSLCLLTMCVLCCRATVRWGCYGFFLRMPWC
jgi:hypothetical protein